MKIVMVLNKLNSIFPSVPTFHLRNERVVTKVKELILRWQLIFLDSCILHDTSYFQLFDSYHDLFINLQGWMKKLNRNFVFSVHSVSFKQNGRANTIDYLTKKKCTFDKTKKNKKKILHIIQLRRNAL